MAGSLRLSITTSEMKTTMKQVLTLLLTTVSIFPAFSQIWTQIGPEGGYFKDFVFHPTDLNTVYAGSDDGGGIWKSIDAGENWTLMTSAFPNMTGWKIIIDENDPNTVYGCDLYSRYGLLKSTDGGLTWQLKNAGLTTAYERMVSGLTIKTSDTLFISTGEGAGSTPPRPGNGVFRSYNGGDAWEPAGLQGESIPCIATNGFGTIFAGSEGFGLYYSNDNGGTWLTHPEIPVSGIVNEIDVEGNVILVASTEGVFLSTNWGINFSNLGLAGAFNFDACIHAVSPDIELFSSTMSGLQYYTSATGTWSLVSGSFFTDQLVIGIGSNGTDILVSGFSNSPIMKSPDGGLSWAEVNSSPTATELNDMFIDPANSDRILTCLLGSYNLNGDFDRESVYETTDGGLSWTRKGPDAHALCITANPLNSQEFYLGSFAQGVYKTTDNFNTWTQLSANGVAVIDVIVSSEDTNVVLISEIDWGLPAVAIKRSSNGGATFNTVSTVIGNRLAFHPDNNDTVYIATNNGLYLSDDFGLTFSPWLLSGEDCRSLAVENGIVYAGTTDGKLFRIENGISSDVSGGWMTPVEIKSILIKGNELFIGLNGAEKDTIMDLHGSIWQSSDQGSSWTDITGNMTSTNIYGNNIIGSDGAELYVGTYGGGIFKSSGMNLDAGIEEMSEVNVIEVYPNPTNNWLWIEKTGPITGFRVMSMNGEDCTGRTRMISMNNNGMTLEVAELDGGIYFLIIESDNLRFFHLKFSVI